MRSERNRPELATPSRGLARAQAATRAFVEDLHAWLVQEDGLDDALEWGALAAGYQLAWVQQESDGMAELVATTSNVEGQWAHALDSLFEPGAIDGHDHVERIRWLDAEHLPLEMYEVGFRNVVIVPLGLGLHGQGHLGMASTRSPRPSVQQRAVLDTLAQTLGLALVARQLLVEQRHHARIAALLATASSLDESAHALGQELRRMTEHDVAALQLYEQGGGVDRVWHMTPEKAHRESIPPPPSNGTGAPAGNGRTRDVADKLREEQGMQAVLSLPLHVGDHRVGTLVLGRRERPFDTADVAPLLGVAPVVASAVDRMRLEDRLRTAEQMATLGGVSRMLAHELRNPLNGVALRVQLLERWLGRMELGSEEADKVAEHLGVVRREIGRLDRLVHDYLGLSRSTPLRFEEVDLRDLVEEACTVQRPTFTEHDVELALQLPSDSAPAMVDRSKILQVLHNLLRNAVEALEGRSHGKIAVELEPSGGWWELRVRDNGPGVGDTKRVFQPGYTSKPLGTGMGLIICRQLVALHEGRLSLRRPEEGGAELVVSLRRTGEAA